MPRKYQRKTETKYKVEDVKQAIEDVKTKKYSLSKASAIYSVPKSTLHDYIRKEGKEIKYGKNAVFTLEQEKVLEEHIIKCGKHFNVITKDMVRKVAFKFADVNKLKHSFDQISQMAGKDWYYGFRKRHPNIDFQRIQSTANFINEADMKMFFNNWEALLYIGANVLCKSVYNDDKTRSSDVQKQFGLRPRRERNTGTTRTDSESSSSGTYYYNPKRLTVLCERVLRRHKLLPAESTPQIEPSDYFVVGGKPLRKRKEPVPEEPKQNKRKTTNPDERPIKKRGRPKSQKEVKKKASGRSSPKKHEMELFTFTPASDNTDTDFEEESVIIKMEELDIPPDNDPFGEEKPEFLVDIKEEFPYNEDNEETNLIEAGPSVTETNILMPTLVPTLKPGQPSTSIGNTGAIPVVSVILDDIQIFANSVAEQLRAMPVNRALLLQLDIQNMLDNEKQIMMHES